MRVTLDQITSLKHARQANADVQALIAARRNEGRALLTKPARTAADEARITAIDAEVSSLTSEAAAITEQLADWERRAGEERASGNPPASDVIRRPTGRRFAQMFPGVPLSMGGFKTTEEFLATLHSGLADSRLVPDYGMRATHTIGTDSQGGFSVPTQMFAQWLDASLESEIVRSRADIRPMTSSSGLAPGWDDGDHSSNLYGGFSGEWIDEAGTMTPQTGKLRLINLKARKLALLTQVSNELLADGMSFEEQLAAAIPKALGWFLDLAFLTGNGANTPLGIFNSPATITVSKETNQAAATINYTNIAKMFARMHPASIGNSVWVCNSTCIPQLLQLSIPIGTAGSAVPVLSESGGQFTMLTRPVLFSEKVSALGTVGDIGLYDFSQYVIGMRAEFSLQKSMHAGFATDTSYYRGIIRVDGQPKRSAVITPKNGDTLSAFVVLQTRS